jgi:hypothetical protein
VAGGSARAIVVLGDIPATGHFANVEALRGPDLTSPSDSALALLDLIAQRLPDASEGILVVYPEWQREPAKRLIRLVRGLLDTDQVASIGLALPPLACSLVADLLSHAAPHLQIGYLAGLGRRLQQEVLSGARVATVAKLEHMDIKLTHHMASYSPGSGFLAWAAPKARVERLTRKRQIGTADLQPDDPILLVAPQGPDFAGFEQDLTSALHPQVVKTVPAQPLGATFWGTRKHVEFVAFSGHPQALSNVVRSIRYWTCPWCRQPCALEVCAICGMFQVEAHADMAGLPGRAPEPPAVPSFPTESDEPPPESAAAVPDDAGTPERTPAAAMAADGGASISFRPGVLRTGPAPSADDDRAVTFGRRTRDDGGSSAARSVRPPEERPVAGSPDPAAGSNGKERPA